MLSNPFNKHPFARDLIWGFFEFTLTFLLLGSFRYAIHEWCHLSVLQFFGGDGYIIKNWLGVGVHITKMPTNLQAVAFAGGLGFAAFCALLMYKDWDDDPEEAAAIPPLLFAELFYGIAEGSWIFNRPDLFNMYSHTFWTIGFLVGILLSGYLMLKWMLRLSEKHKGYKYNFSYFKKLDESTV